MTTAVRRGENFKEVVTEKLLTQVKLAEKVSVNPGTVVLVVRNRAKPQFRTIASSQRSLRRTLGVHGR